MDTVAQILLCPYCKRPLRWVSNRWFGHGTYECSQCGDFPDLSALHAPPGANSEHTDRGPGLSTPHRERPRVLLIDDSIEHLDFHATILRHAATVMTAARGEDGVALASVQKPHAIVLDVMMPGMDGWQVCEQLKANPATSDIPIIMLTSLDAIDVPERARSVGAVAVLMKPCPVERLLLTINAAMRPRVAHPN